MIKKLINKLFCKSATVEQSWVLMSFYNEDEHKLQYVLVSNDGVKSPTFDLAFEAELWLNQQQPPM